MPMLARDRVRFIGEKVAVVAAEDRNVAEEAAQLIEVEYEALPAVFDPLVAITEGAPQLHEGLRDYKGLPNHGPPSTMSIRMRRGLSGMSSRDFATRIIFSKTPLRRSMFISRISSPIRALSPSIGETGTIHVWISNKVPYNTKQSLSEAIGVPLKKSSFTSLPSAATSAARERSWICRSVISSLNGTGRPVRMIMTYTEELTAGNPRHAVGHRREDGGAKRRHPGG